mmetsp:Transcript_18345/g.54350  ORF Transcript_18345/g.54350 Transcript_18345/m.54350 type:complete len:235 (-) Transcript_18345:29-733(-)
MGIVVVVQLAGYRFKWSSQLALKKAARSLISSRLVGIRCEAGWWSSTPCWSAWSITLPCSYNAETRSPSVQVRPRHWRAPSCESTRGGCFSGAINVLRSRKWVCSSMVRKYPYATVSLAFFDPCREGAALTAPCMFSWFRSGSSAVPGRNVSAIENTLPSSTPSRSSGKSTPATMAWTERRKAGAAKAYRPRLVPRRRGHRLHVACTYPAPPRKSSRPESMYRTENCRRRYLQN